MGEVVSLPSRIEIQPDNIPPELIAKDRWVLWGWERRNPGSDKLTKPPYQTNGKSADVSKPDTWTSFEKVLKVLAKGNRYHGVGFMLQDEDDIVAWDLDHCIDVKSGQLTDWAEKIVTGLNSYTEITPSGEGLRIFVTGKVPQNGRKTGGIECYQHARYITVTGNHYTGTPKVINPADNTIWNSIFAHAKDVKKSKEKGSEHTKNLWEGKWKEAGYPSQSEADLAFCKHLTYETDGNAERIDVLFRQSKLFREKWDKVHHGDGDTYGQATIKLALEGFNDRIKLTDLGNARRLAGLISDEARFCHGRWYIWDGKRLGEDQKQVIFLLGNRVIEQINDEAKVSKDEKQAESLRKHAFKLEARGQLENMIFLTQHQPTISVLPEELDANIYTFNCDNGILTEKGTLLPHLFEEMITKISPIGFDPNAECPIWEKFLCEVMPDEEMIDYLRRAVGYSMTGDVKEQKLFFAYGSGQNGKSTFFHAIQKVFGDYFSSMPVESLMASKGDQHPTVLADLRGVRFVLASEPEEGRRFNEGLLKQITGGEPIVARRMREDFFRFDSSAKLWIMGNHRPTIRGTDFAIWRRIHLIPFTITISKEDQDKDLWKKLEMELPGILRWCFRGYQEWMQRGLDPPAAVLVATEDYRAEMDIIQDFLTEETVILANTWTLHSEIYARYAGGAKDKNERLLSSKVFGQKLREKGYTDQRKTGNHLYWSNLVLRESKYKQTDEM